MTNIEQGSLDRAPVSIVCVYNDAVVLETCLARSVQSGISEAPETEFIAVDNRAGAFSTAGAALNFGAARATNDVVVFVHQDVFLHSLVELERAAHELRTSDDIGVMGAIGVDARRLPQGRIRDRVMMLGTPASAPRDVDSLDEVLFLVSRSQLVTEPLADDPALGWHAYAVEYCARVRSRGERAVALDIPLTHNSMTTNLAKLDVAHARVGDLYPQVLPLQTTCGEITARPGAPYRAALRRVRGGAVWAAESRRAGAIARQWNGGDVLLADIRFVVDDLADAVSAVEITALNATAEPTAADAVGGISRRGRSFHVRSVRREELVAAVQERAADTLLVVTNLELRDVAELAGSADAALVGLSRDTGIWIAFGVGRDALPAALHSPRHTPIRQLVKELPARLARHRRLMNAATSHG